MTPGGLRNNRTSLRILYVDDDVVNLRVLQDMMEACGISLTGAPSARDGLDRLAAETFDLVLMDIHMPEIGGVAALHELRRRSGANRGVPVVAITADLSRDEVHYRAIGFDGFVAKPVSMRALMKAVLTAISAARRTAPVPPPADPASPPLVRR